MQQLRCLSTTTTCKGAAIKRPTGELDIVNRHGCCFSTLSISFCPDGIFLVGLFFFFFHEPPVRQGNLKAPLYYFLTGVFVWKMGKYQERTFTGKGIFCKKLKKSWKSLNNDAYNNKTTWLNASIIFV